MSGERKGVGSSLAVFVEVGSKRDVHKLFTVELTRFWVFFYPYLSVIDLSLVFILKHTIHERTK